MESNSAWQRFFDGHAPRYDENCFTKNTVAEVDFLTETLRITPPATILDVGCGTGRHAIELARRGFRVTGVDLSDGMLAQARAKALAAGVDVTWRRADATRLTVDHPFEAAICLCEGAFGLLGQGDDPIGQPLAILRRIADALLPSAPCLLTVLSAFRMIRRHGDADVEKGDFDPLALAEISDCPHDLDPTLHPMRERGFVPTELVLLLQLAGLEALHLWGGTAGNWGRRKIDLDEYEIMVIARKHAGTT